MDKEIALVQSRTFWAALFALIAVVAQDFGWAQAFAVASDPGTVNGVMTVVTTGLTLLAVLFARLPTGKITKLLPPGSAPKAGAAAAIIAALLVFPLFSGCATLKAISTASGLTVTQGQLDALETAYDGAVLTPAATYRQLGYCATGTIWTLAKPCADRTIVAKLRAADSGFVKALATAQALVTSGNNSGLSAAYALAQQALTTAEAVATTLPTSTTRAAN